MEEPSVEKAIDMIVENEGRIDDMVANAGMTKLQPALQFTREEIEKLFNLNVRPSCPPRRNESHRLVGSLKVLEVLRLSRSRRESSGSREESNC